MVTQRYDELFNTYFTGEDDRIDLYSMDEDYMIRVEKARLNYDDEGKISELLFCIRDFFKDIGTKSWK